LEETKVAVEGLGEELWSKQSESLSAEVAKSVSLAVSSQFGEIRGKCERLITSVSEAAYLQQQQQQEQLGQGQGSGPTREQLEELHGRWEREREVHEETLMGLMDQKLQKLGIELESRVQNRVEKKVSSSVERKLKLQQDQDVEIGEFAPRQPMTCASTGVLRPGKYIKLLTSQYKVAHTEFTSLE
jgi:hypothetical protein